MSGTACVGADGGQYGTTLSRTSCLHGRRHKGSVLPKDVRSFTALQLIVITTAGSPDIKIVRWRMNSSRSSLLHSPLTHSSTPTTHFRSLTVTAMASSISRSVVKKVLSQETSEVRAFPNDSRHDVTSTGIHRWCIIGRRGTRSPLDRFSGTTKLDAFPHARPLPYWQGCST